MLKHSAICANYRLSIALSIKLTKKLSPKYRAVLKKRGVFFLRRRLFSLKQLLGCGGSNFEKYIVKGLLWWGKRRFWDEKAECYVKTLLNRNRDDGGVRRHRHLCFSGERKGHILLEIIRKGGRGIGAVFEI